MREEPEDRPSSRAQASLAELQKELERLKKSVQAAAGHATACRSYVRHGAQAQAASVSIVTDLLSQVRQMTLDLGAPEEEPVDLPDERRSTDRDIAPSDRARARALDQKEQALCQKEQASLRLSTIQIVYQLKSKKSLKALQKARMRPPVSKPGGTAKKAVKEG
jgi:hypothetical protein